MPNTEGLTPEELSFDSTVPKELHEELRTLYTWITESGGSLGESANPVSALTVIRLLQKTPNELYAFLGYRSLPRLRDYVAQLEKSGEETWVE